MPEEFRALSEWMVRGGGDISKITLQNYDTNYRGVQARVDIKKGEQILFVPENLILTF